MEERFIESLQNTKSVSERIELCESAGFNVGTRPMGSGGVFQCKKMRNGEIRYQISAGWGRYNYAYCVIL